MTNSGLKGMSCASCEHSPFERRFAEDSLEQNLMEAETFLELEVALLASISGGCCPPLGSGIPAGSSSCLKGLCQVHILTL